MGKVIAMEKSDPSGKIYIVRDSSLRLTVAALWGALIGGLTLAAGPLSVLSPHGPVAMMQRGLTILMLPGLLAAIGVGSLAVGGLVNGAVHFGLCWLLFPAFSRLSKNFKTEENLARQQPPAVPGDL